MRPWSDFGNAIGGRVGSALRSNRARMADTILAASSSISRGSAATRERRFSGDYSASVIDDTERLPDQVRNIATPTRMELITHFKGRRVFRLHFAPVVDSGGRDIGVAQPFLDLGNIGFVIEGVGGGGGAQRVGADLEA